MSNSYNNRIGLPFPLMIAGIVFFMIGFGIGISGFLTPALRSAFNLSNGQSYLVLTAIFSAFVIFSRPAGWIIKKIGYRKSLMLSFFIMALGMWIFVPSSYVESFPLFLVALFIGGIGNTILQAAINPYVIILGPEDTAAVRISLMGIMNKLAWWVAPVFLGLFIDLSNVQLDDVVLPFYIVTGILTLVGILIYFAPLPELKAAGEDDDDTTVSESSYAAGKRSVLQFPHLLLGVAALFATCGIEGLPLITIIDFGRSTFGEVDNLESFTKFVTLGMVAGYLFGVIAMPRLISQSKALYLFSVLGILSSIILIFLPPKIAFYGLILTSFSISLMWPIIWPLALKDLGRFTKTGATMLVMTLVGAAIVPLIFGFIVDAVKTTEQAVAADYQTAYWVMVPSFLFILYYAISGHKIRTK
ncbi:MAG: MFS transporter [Bacteroidota bacterium]